MRVDPAAHERRWWALGVLTLPVLIISMDSTILGFAVPQLSEALQPSSSQLLWIVDIYSFVLAGLLITMGSLGDRIGRRRLLVAGAVAFSAASLLAAFATDANMLIGARALLGVAGATLMPSTLSLLRNVFIDPRERQTAIALWATAFAAGTALGPIVGGFLLEHYWWGSVFTVGIPVTALLAVLAPRLVPESKDPNPGAFDLVSAGLSMVAMLPTVFAVKLVAERGWSASAMVALTIGITAGVVFVRRQRRLVDPMIDVSLFAVPKFRMAVTGNLVACFGFAGTMFFVTQHLQLVVGMSPLRAGVQLLPAVAATIVFMLLAPVAARRWGPFAVIAAGLGCGAVGFVLLAQVGADGSTAIVTAAVIVLNAGLGAAMTVAVDGIMAAIPAEHAGAGASVSETANELGIALGTAVLGSIMIAVYRANLGSPTGIGPNDLADARETLGAAVSASERLGDPAGPALLEAARGAFVDGVRAASLVAVVALAVVAAWALRSRLADSPKDATAPSVPTAAQR